MERDRLEYPLIVLERETGRLWLLSSLDDARSFAEEFQDILDSDFTIWDPRGRRLTMSEEFVRGETEHPGIRSDDVAGLAEAFRAYGESREVDEDTLRSIRALPWRR